MCVRLNLVSGAARARPPRGGGAKVWAGQEEEYRCVGRVKIMTFRTFFTSVYQSVVQWQPTWGWPWGSRRQIIAPSPLEHATDIGGLVMKLSLSWEFPLPDFTDVVTCNNNLSCMPKGVGLA